MADFTTADLEQTILNVPPEPGLSLTWGTGTSDGRIIPDNATEPVDVHSTAAQIVEDGRYLCAWQRTQLIVIGPPTFEEYTPPDPVMRMQSGQVTFSVFTNSTTTVSFSPVFASAPRVLTAFAEDTEGAQLAVNAESVSTSSATIRVRAPDNWGGPLTINWLAVPDGSLAI